MTIEAAAPQALVTQKTDAWIEVPAEWQGSELATKLQLRSGVKTGFVIVDEKEVAMIDIRRGLKLVEEEEE